MEDWGDLTKLPAERYMQTWQAICSKESGLKANFTREELDAHRERILLDEWLVLRLMRRHSLKSKDEVKKLFSHPARAEEGHIQWMAKELLGCMATSDRIPLQDVPVGMLPTNDFNAELIKSPSGEPIIVLRNGTVSLLHNAVIAFLKTIPTLTSAPQWTIRQGAFWCLQWLGAFAFEKPVYGIEKMPALGDSERIRASGTVVDMAIAFIVGHEFGHLILGHPIESKIVRRTLVPHAPPLDFYKKEQEQEFDADARGVELAIGFCKENSKGSFQIVFLAVELVYNVLYLLEVLRPSDARTHPPAGLRRAAFVKLKGDMFDSEIKREIACLGKFFGAVEEMVKNVLADPANLATTLAEVRADESRLGLDGGRNERAQWPEHVMRCLEALREKDYSTAALALANAFEKQRTIFEPDADVVRRELVRGALGQKIDLRSTLLERHRNRRAVEEQLESSRSGLFGQLAGLATRRPPPLVDLVSNEAPEELDLVEAAVKDAQQREGQRADFYLIDALQSAWQGERERSIMSFEAAVRAGVSDADGKLLRFIQLDRLALALELPLDIQKLLVAVGREAVAGKKAGARELAGLVVAYTDFLDVPLGPVARRIIDTQLRRED